MQSAAMAAIVTALRGGVSGETLARMVAAAELALRLSSEGEPSSAAPPVALPPAASDAALPAPAGQGGPAGAASAAGGARAAAVEEDAAVAVEINGRQQDGAAPGARPRLSLKIKLGQGAPAAQQGTAPAASHGSRKRGLEAETVAEPDQDAELQPPRKRHRLGAAPQESAKGGVPAPDGDAAVAGDERQQAGREVLPNGTDTAAGSREEAAAEGAAADAGAPQCGQDGLARSAPDKATEAGLAADAAAVLGEETEHTAAEGGPGLVEDAAAKAMDPGPPAEPVEAEQEVPKEAGEADGMQADAAAEPGLGSGAETA
jgi:hypothetical protein